MKFDDLKKLVEQQITEVSKDPVKAAENAIIYYFKELAGAEGDTDYQEARRFAADFNTVMQRAPNSDRNDFNTAWNNLVDANKLWYHKEDGKGIYTFASNQKEIKKLQNELAPQNIDLQKPSQDAPEKMAPKPKDSGGVAVLHLPKAASAGSRSERAEHYLIMGILENKLRGLRPDQPFRFSEKQEDEKVMIFESRLLSDVKKILGIEIN